MAKIEDRYLGDGVYASFDGYQIWLAADSHDSETRIALEPEVFEALVNYAEHIATVRRELENKNG